MWKLPFDHITKALLVRYLINLNIFADSNQWFFVEEQLYTLSISLTKLSILFFYLRIFPDAKFRRIVYGVIAITICYCISFTVVQYLHCIPVSANWNGWDGEHPARCTNLKAQSFSGAATNITLDLVICLLPIPQLIKLHLSIRKKIGITLMFCVGLL